MIELWKTIKGYEGLYEVSNTGKVRSVDRIVNDKNGRPMKLKGKELFFTISKIDNRGHKPRARVQLWRNNKSRLLQVHRLVASAFLENPENFLLYSSKIKFKLRQRRLTVYMLLTSSVLSTTSKLYFEQPAASFLVCSLIFIEYYFPF